MIAQFIRDSWVSARLAGHQKKQGVIGKRGLESLIEPRAAEPAACAYVPQTSTAPKSAGSKKTGLQCWKDDTELMKDHANWKFVEAEKLREAIGLFCERDWSPGGNDVRDWNLTLPYFKDNSDWNEFNLTVAGAIGTGAVKADCKKHFARIFNDCDMDKQANQYE